MSSQAGARPPEIFPEYKKGTGKLEDFRGKVKNFSSLASEVTEFNIFFVYFHFSHRFDKVFRLFYVLKSQKFPVAS